MSRRADLVHPLPIAAIALLLVNDHLLKGAGVLPGTLTGKLSDVAGLFFFPVLLTTLVEAIARFPRRRVALGSALATGLVFSLLKTVPALAALATSAWGVVVCDPTDLLALPALAASLAFLERNVAFAPPPRWARAAVVLVAALASVATSRPMEARNYPMWETREAERDLGCTHASAYVGKSGKEGFGLVVRLDPQRRCAVAIVGASATIGGERVAAAELPQPLAIESPEPRFLYVPFAFDNETAWNDGRRDGTAELRLRVGDREETWAFAIHERFDSFHRHIDRDGPPPASSARVLERAGGPQ